MNIEDRAIWQVAAGNGNKNYSTLCLQQNIIMIGPGNYGAWPDCEKEMRKDGITSRRIGIVRRFAEDMKTRDIIVLRVGTQKVYGVGELVGGYDWSDDYQNVDGWDLQHSRRVRWLWHQDGEPKTFPVYSLKLGNSVQKLTSPEVRHWLHSLNIAEGQQ